MIPQSFYRVSVKALVLDEQKRFLLTKESNGVWELPGGGLDFGEDVKTCLRREVREEMGLAIDFISDQPSYFLVARNSQKYFWATNVVYATTLSSLDFTPSDECTEIRFFTKEEAMKVATYQTIDQFIEMYQPENH